MPCPLPLWLFLCLLPARVCRQVVARSFLSGALRPFHVCPSPQTGNGHAHSASRNVDRCSKMVCFPGDFRYFLVRSSNVHCPPGHVFLSTYQCLPVHLSMLFCLLINVSLSFINVSLYIYQCFFAHLSMFHHPFILPLSSFLFASFMLIYFIY